MILGRKPSCQGLVVIDEDQQQPILIHKIENEDIYQRQGGSNSYIIQWADLYMQTEIALSFEDLGGCDALWNQINDVHRGGLQKLQGNEQHARKGSVDEVEAQTQGSLFQTNESNNFFFDIPEPTLNNLQDIATKLSEVPPNTKEQVAQYLIQHNFLSRIFELFHEADNIGYKKKLNDIYVIMKSTILLNDSQLLEEMFRPNNIFQVVGALEYDPSSVFQVQHRRHLQEKLNNYKEIVPFKTPSILQKVHQTYQIQYLKDVVLPRVLDDMTFQTLHSLILLNHMEIVTAIQHDNNYLEMLFEKLKSVDPTSPDWEQMVGVIQELITMLRPFDRLQRNALYTQLTDLGLFSIMHIALQQENTKLKERALVTLHQCAINEPKELIKYIQFEKNNLLGLMIKEYMHGSDNGFPEIIQEILKFLLDPESLEAPFEKSPFLEYFYNQYMDCLIEVLVGDENSQQKYLKNIFNIDPEVIPNYQNFEDSKSSSQDNNTKEVKSDTKQDDVANLDDVANSDGEGKEDKDNVQKEDSSSFRSEAEQNEAQETDINEESNHVESKDEDIDFEKPLTDEQNEHDSANFAEADRLAQEQLAKKTDAKQNQVLDPVSKVEVSEEDKQQTKNVVKKQTQSLSSVPSVSQVSPFVIYLIADLVQFCVEKHQFRIKYYMMRQGIIEKITKLFNRPQKWLQIAPVRILRTCLGLKEDFYIKIMIQRNSFLPILEHFIKNGIKNENLLHSTILELFEFIRTENIRDVIVHLFEGSNDRMKEVLEQVIHINPFTNLSEKYDQIMNLKQGINMEKGYQSPNLTWQQLQFKRKRRDDRDLEKSEEDYFSNDEDPDNFNNSFYHQNYSAAKHQHYIISNNLLNRNKVLNSVNKPPTIADLENEKGGNYQFFAFQNAQNNNNKQQQFMRRELKNQILNQIKNSQKKFQRGQMKQPNPVDNRQQLDNAELYRNNFHNPELQQSKYLQNFDRQQRQHQARQRELREKELRQNEQRENEQRQKEQRQKEQKNSKEKRIQVNFKNKDKGSHKAKKLKSQFSPVKLVESYSDDSDEEDEDDDGDDDLDHKS